MYKHTWSYMYIYIYTYAKTCEPRRCLPAHPTQILHPSVPVLGLFFQVIILVWTHPSDAHHLQSSLPYGWTTINIWTHQADTMIWQYDTYWDLWSTFAILDLLLRDMDAIWPCTSIYHYAHQNNLVVSWLIGAPPVIIHLNGTFHCKTTIFDTPVSEKKGGRKAPWG